MAPHRGQTVSVAADIEYPFVAALHELFYSEISRDLIVHVYRDGILIPGITLLVYQHDRITVLAYALDILVARVIAEEDSAAYQLAVEQSLDRSDILLNVGQAHQRLIAALLRAVYRQMYELGRKMRRNVLARAGIALRISRYQADDLLLFSDEAARL